MSSTKIGCDWNEIPPQGINGNLRGYRIKFRLYDAGNRISVWNSTDYSISTKSAEISMLKEYTRYEVMVLGFTAAGESPPVWTQLLTDQDGK